VIHSSMTTVGQSTMEGQSNGSFTLESRHGKVCCVS